MADRDVPLGAIHNGRELFRRVAEHYNFECEGGRLADCREFQEALQCFGALAEFALPAPGAGGSGGMDQRTCAAIHVANGMLAHSTRYRPRPGAPSNWHDALAEEAVEIADAIMAALDRGGAS